MSSYYFGPVHPKGVRIDWEPGERIRVDYKYFGKRRRRKATIRRVDGTHVLLEFKNQFILTWFRMEDLRKV